MSTTATAPGLVPAPRLILAGVRANLLETMRVPMAVIGTVAFPALALLFFVVPQGAVRDDPAAATQAVISMGVFIGASTKIVDRTTGETFMGRVPSYSVVVPGSLPGKPLAGRNEPGPSLACAVIVKRVDERTRSKTSINELLRD